MRGELVRLLLRVGEGPDTRRRPDDDDFVGGGGFLVDADVAEADTSEAGWGVGVVNRAPSGVIFQGNRSYDAMKEWILVGCNNAGFKPREGGPIKSTLPWTAETTTQEKQEKGNVPAAEIVQLTEMAKYSAEEIGKLRDRTQQLLDIVMA